MAQLTTNLASGAIGYTAGGTTGASTAATLDRYNRQLTHTEKERIQSLANGDQAKEARLAIASCALVHCAAQLPIDSEAYRDYSQLEALGNSPEFAAERTLLSQQTTPIFPAFFGINPTAYSKPIDNPLFTYTDVDNTFDVATRWDETYQIRTRAGGTAQALAGAATTTGALAATSATCAGTAGTACLPATLAGATLAAFGTDQLQAGLSTLINGKPQPTFGAQLLEQYLGTSPDTAELIYGMMGVSPATLLRPGATAIAQELVAARAAKVFAKGEQGAVADANFAQKKIYSQEKFSEGGSSHYSELLGTPINTVDDLAGAIRTGLIKPSELPVDYVYINGTKLILNTRTSIALERAGIPKSRWYGRNRTGVLVPEEGGKIFDDLARDQLASNKLPTTGTPNIPKGGK